MENIRACWHRKKRKEEAAEREGSVRRGEQIPRKAPAVIDTHRHTQTPTVCCPLVHTHTHTRNINTGLLTQTSWVSVSVTHTPV